MTSPSEGMLAPYRVLDLTDERGLLAGMLLADLGADVIAVEPPGGSPARRLGPFAGDSPGPENSLWWQAYARNKRGVTLDITHPDGQALFRTLAPRCDVLIESFTPGYLDSLGLSPERLLAEHPHLVITSITPFGRTGPKASWPATDLTVMAASGAQFVAGDPDRAPLGVAVPQAFLFASVEAASGTLIALAERRRSGQGQLVDVSAQQAAAAATQSFILADAWHDDFLARDAGGFRRGGIKLRYTYPASDGYVSITFDFGNAVGPGTQRLMQWIVEEGFSEPGLGQKDWIGYGALLLSGEESASELERVYETVARFTASKTKAELFEGARRRGLFLAPIATVEDVRRSPQLAERSFWTPAAPGDEFRHPGPFARFSETPIQYRRRAPRVGEHNAEIYGGELRLRSDELSLLAGAGVI